MVSPTLPTLLLSLTALTSLRLATYLAAPSLTGAPMVASAGVMYELWKKVLRVLWMSKALPAVLLNKYLYALWLGCDSLPQDLSLEFSINMLIMEKDILSIHPSNLKTGDHKFMISPVALEETNRLSPMKDTSYLCPFLKD